MIWYDRTQQKVLHVNYTGQTVSAGKILPNEIVMHPDWGKGMTEL